MTQTPSLKSKRLVDLEKWDAFFAIFSAIFGLALLVSLLGLLFSSHNPRQIRELMSHRRSDIMSLENRIAYLEGRDYKIYLMKEAPSLDIPNLSPKPSYMTIVEWEKFRETKKEEEKLDMIRMARSSLSMHQKLLSDHVKLTEKRMQPWKWISIISAILLIPTLLGFATTRSQISAEEHRLRLKQLRRRSGSVKYKNS